MLIFVVLLVLRCHVDFRISTRYPTKIYMPPVFLPHVYSVGVRKSGDIDPIYFYHISGYQYWTYLYPEFSCAYSFVVILLSFCSITSSPLCKVLIGFQKYGTLFLCVFIVLFMTHSINEIWTDSVKMGTVSKDSSFQLTISRACLYRVVYCPFN